MRKRNVQIVFCLTSEEAEYLSALVKLSGHTRSSFLRFMIKGYRLCEKPEPEFYEVMRELSRIGNNVNQLAMKIHSLGLVDASRLDDEAKRWHQLQIEIREKYLLPKKVAK